MHTLLQMYQKPIEDLVKLPDGHRQLKKVFDYLKEYQIESLSDILMDKELDKIYTEITFCELVSNYVKPDTAFRGDLDHLKAIFKKTKETYDKPILRKRNWAGMSWGYYYVMFAENLIENIGYNKFIVQDEFELNLITAYFDTAYSAIKGLLKMEQIKYPAIVDFNNRIKVSSIVYSEYPIGTELPHIYNIPSN